MGTEDLNKLNEICEVLKKFRDTTVDGNGRNLHDIKVTFDYVKKTMEQNNLVGTAFGNEFVSKMDNAGMVLSQLWSCLKNLETSIHNFVDNQSRYNATGHINTQISPIESYK